MSTSALAGLRVLERVGQALLDDAVGGEVDRDAGAGTGSPSTCSSTGRPARRISLEQRVEARRARAAAPSSGRRRSRRIAPSSRRISASAARPVSSTPRSASTSSGELVGQPVPDGAGLQHHHADRVGDDVVQLAGDPGALLGDGDARRHLALALGLARALLRRLGLHGPLALREAAEPGEREHGRDQQRRRWRRGRVVERDDRRAARDDAPARCAPGARRAASRSGTRRPCRRRRGRSTTGSRRPSRNDSAAASSHSHAGREERRALAGEQRQHERQGGQRPRGRSASCPACAPPPRRRPRPPRGRSADPAHGVVRTASRGERTPGRAARLLPEEEMGVAGLGSVAGAARVDLTTWWVVKSTRDPPGRTHARRASDPGARPARP